VGVTLAGVYGVRVDGVERRVPAEPLPVEVLHDGVWFAGRLLEWQRWPSGWRALCRWSVVPGEQYMRWINGDRVRPRG